MDTFAHQRLTRLKDELSAAPPVGRGELVATVAAQLGLTPSTVYTRLKDLGWSSGRKARADKGSSVVSRDALVEIATMTAAARDRRGTPNLPVSEAHRIAQDAGLEAGEVSYATLTRRLRAERLGPAAMCAPKPTIFRVSTHPNQTWQIDASVCVQWDFRRAGTGGVELAQAMDAERRFYTGKPENFKTLRQMLIRWMVVDHYSGVFFPFYSYTSGEKSEDAIECLYRAMADKPEVADAFPFRGMPDVLCADQGSAFKNQWVTNLLSAEFGLGIELQLHAAGNAPATGSVEKAHDIWGKCFEGRLRARYAPDLETLNRWALLFAADANNDARRKHRRHGHVRMDVWSRITSEQLREAPDRQLFYQLAAGNLREATLTTQLCISVKGKLYQVASGSIYPGQKINYRLTPFQGAGIRAWDAEGRELSLKYVPLDAAGFPAEGALAHTWGDPERTGARHQLAAGQQVARAVEAAPELAHRPEMFDDIPERLASIHRLSPVGRPFAPPANGALVAEPLLSSLDARRAVVAALGRALSPDEGAWWAARIGDGITAGALEDLLDNLDAHHNQPAIRAV